MATERMARLGAANMAKMMGLLCVADSKLGEFGEGERPATTAGDYSDVVVVDAEGRIIPWQRVARFDGAEMTRMRREIVDKLFTFSPELRGTGAGGAPRSSAGRDLEMAQAQGRFRTEQADGGARKRHRRERSTLIRRGRSGYRSEVFAMLYLDNRNRLMAFQEHFRGTVDGTSVHPRVVVHHALMHNATA